VLAVVTGLDYFDNATFAFFASYIAGWRQCIAG
jgi:hypothetical protein